MWDTLELGTVPPVYEHVLDITADSSIIMAKLTEKTTYYIRILIQDQEGEFQEVTEIATTLAGK